MATRSSTIAGQKVVLTLYPVLRDGSTSHVNLSLSTRASSRVQLAQALTDANGDTSDKSPFAADGIQLVDGKNAKLYLVASDGHGTCLCSRNLTNVFVGAGAPLLISATFAAPPADVSTVDVRVPSFGTVTSVPVS